MSIRVPGRPLTVVLILSSGVPAAEAQAPPVIAHDGVACVVAERYPRLRACFTPAEAVARAQVQFRADEKGPWYSVDMKEDGACRAAVLPKPKKDVGQFRYFIEVIGRAFDAHHSPEAAPGESYAPRVVESEAACGAGLMIATSSPTATVLVGIARDAAGKALTGALAHGAELQGLAGFSTEGVSMATGAGAGAAPQGAEGAGGSAGGVSKTVLIAGGAAAAVGLVAVAAGGGDGGSGAGSGAGPGQGPGGSTGSQTVTLSGRWTGSVDRGDGIVTVASGLGLTCTNRSDLTADLVHNGSTLTGTGTTVTRVFDCSVPLPASIAPLLSSGGSGSLSGTASGGVVTFTAGTFTFTGTYTATRLEASATMNIEGLTFTSTLRLNKQ